MDRQEKQKILIFAREAFRKFYDENYSFLSERKYKPGKRTYRNLLSLNKMMKQYLGVDEDYISREVVINNTGWNGSSSYVQHERIITNFGLSDTSWEDNSRPILLLSEKGKRIKKQYQRFVENNPDVDLMTLSELPNFAKKYLIEEIRNTDSTNMTLWKNTIITALFLYCELGYMPYFTSTSDAPTPREKRALIYCCNYTSENDLMDITYIQQPVAMLRNIDLLDEDRKLTVSGYKLLSNMRLFGEVEASLSDFEESLPEDLEEVERILSSSVHLEEEQPPERKVRTATPLTSPRSGPKNKDFDKAAKADKLTGNLGEKLVLDYEKKRLLDLGVTNIEDRVFLTSSKKKEFGNAYPCDIISYDPDTGREIYIEVKTTKGSAEDPFYISHAEVDFSLENADVYKLYRVYHAFSKSAPKFYVVSGSVRDNFSLKEDRYIASRFLNN